MRHSRRYLIVAALAVAVAWGEDADRLAALLKRFPAADTDHDGTLTAAEARAFARQLRGERARTEVAATPKPTYADVRYGPHERNVLDIWLAPGEQTHPLLVCIHGGGFMSGDKRRAVNADLIRGMHDAGISVASLNYRLTDGGKNPFPAPMLDCGRAIQFLRCHADKLHLEKDRFAATGGSAGGCILLWLGFHPDLADPDSADPVLRESSRLQALAPKGAQPCLHLPTLEQWFDSKLALHPAFPPLFGIAPNAAIQWTAHLDAAMRAASAITYLTADDPPVWAVYGAPNVPVTVDTPASIWVHHPVMGIELKKAMDGIGVPCWVQYPGGPAAEGYSSQQDFIIRELTGE